MRLPRWRNSVLLLLLLIAACLHENATATNQVGTKWLQQKAKASHVKERPSGLLYKRMTKGKGKMHPSFDAFCKIEIEISRVVVHDSKDGSRTEIVESTSSHSEPSIARPIDSLPAVREVLQLMVEGDWTELYVPSHLGYGGGGKLRPKEKQLHGEEALLISVELVSIISGDKIPKGERHDCYMELGWDPVTGQYGYQPTERCDKRDRAYIAEAAAWDSRSLQAEEKLSRLRSLLQKGNMKDSLALWVRRRMHILKQFLLEDMRICTIFFVNTPDQGSVLFQEDCNAQEQEYVAKVQEWEEEKVKEEINRLGHLDQDSVDAALGSWIRRRIRILNQMLSLRSAGGSEGTDGNVPANNHDEEL